MSNELFDLKKLTEYYIKQKEIEILKLDEKGKKYNENIAELKEAMEKSKDIKEKLQFNNLLLKDKYNSLKRIIKERGVIIDINNKNYNVKEWDNLLLFKDDNKYCINTKKSERLIILDDAFSGIVQEIMNDTKFYSIIVIHVSDKVIKVQLRFTDKNIKE